MTRVLHESDDTDLDGARPEGDALWLDPDDLERATGWRAGPAGMCRGDVCAPLPPVERHRLVDGASVDAAGIWRVLGWPVARDATGALWVLGEAATTRATALASLEAPDFELPDLQGRAHRLSSYRGRRVLLVTWASWCGCRADLPTWGALQEEASAHPFTVVAVALDEAEAARPWIEAAAPSHPCLVDRDHRIAELYGLVNVPQAVWIDEAGRVARPPETAGFTDAFRRMDRATFAMPADAAEERRRAKDRYLAAVRDWAARGAASAFALEPDEVRARLPRPDASTAQAHVWFRLGQALAREGRGEDAAAAFSEATRLHPASWAMWRQAAEKDARGLAVGDAFWRRVDALGDRPYYPPADLSPRGHQGST